MKLFAGALIVLGSLTAVDLLLTAQAQQQGTFTGTVQRVWEDGFRLDTGDRTLRVDAWEIHGDATARHIAVGDQITVSGEFSGREFDAASISPDSKSSSTSQSVP